MPFWPRNGTRLRSTTNSTRPAWSPYWTASASTHPASVSTYGQWTLTRYGLRGAGALWGASPSPSDVTDADFGVRSNSLFIGPNRPSAKALTWCGSMPIVIARYGTTRCSLGRTDSGEIGSG